MDSCVIDKVPEHHTPPSRQAIEQARQRQMTALREVRRLLVQASAMAIRAAARAR